MRKLLYILPFAAAMLAACDKNAKNGDLDGQWQLLEQHVKSSASAPNFDVMIPRKADQAFWRVQLDLINLHSKQRLATSGTEVSFDVMARFVHADHRLAITETYIHFRERDSLLTSSTTCLTDFGIRSNTANFRVARLNKSSMILVSEADSLVFRKF